MEKLVITFTATAYKKNDNGEADRKHDTVVDEQDFKFVMESLDDWAELYIEDESIKTEFDIYSVESEHAEEILLTLESHFEDFNYDYVVFDEVSIREVEDDFFMDDEDEENEEEDFY